MKKIISFLFVGFLLSSCTGTGEYKNLTVCLRENKAVMFGASWCPHCAEQKKLFGRSAKDMPYFECSKWNDQVKECAVRGIISYPTWQFNEEALRALPEVAQINLLNPEIEIVRASIKNIRDSISATDTASLKIINDFSAETEAMIVSDLTPFEKLTKLTTLSIWSDKKSVQKLPIYTLGRIAGARPLDEIALYSGCTDAYKKDTATQSPQK